MCRASLIAARRASPRSPAATDEGAGLLSVGGELCGEVGELVAASLVAGVVDDRSGGFEGGAGVVDVAGGEVEVGVCEVGVGLEEA